MTNPLLQKIKNKLSPHRARVLWARLRWVALGLAHDYWKDGRPPVGEGKPKRRPMRQTEDTAPKFRAADPRQTVMGADGLWRALPGEMSERMWGRDYVTPGDEELTERLIIPLGLKKDMLMLDLSAGLGGRQRKTVQQFGLYVDGLEPDPDIAQRGMEMSIASGLGKHATINAYDPANLTAAHSYDCIVARETLYRIADKEKFIHSVVACCKPKAQISFTDYIVNPEMRDEPGIVAWRAFETNADPAGLVEMAELWAKAGFNLRVHDDQTEYYKKEVMHGLARFAKFMASGVKPDPVTRKAIDKRITTWAHRMAALEAGMKFYRFYGVR